MESVSFYQRPIREVTRSPKILPVPPKFQLKANSKYISSQSERLVYGSSEDKSKGPELCFSLQLRDFKSIDFSVSPSENSSPCPPGGKEHWMLLQCSSMLWVEKGKISFSTSPPPPYILFLSHKVSVLLLWGKFTFDLLHCLSLVLMETELIWVQLRLHRWTRWTYWPICKTCFYSTQAHILLLFLILFFMCFLLRVLEGKKKKKKSHFEPLIFVTCLERSRHSTKSFISKLVKHESFPGFIRS